MASIIMGRRNTGKSGHLRRLGIATALATLLSTVAVGATPGGASAAVEIPCPSDAFPASTSQQSEGAETKGIVIIVRTLYRYVSVVSSTSTFDVGYARILDNSGNSAPLTASITTETSQTFSVTVTVGSTQQLTQLLNRTVSAQIVASITTRFGVTIGTTVAPNSRLLAEYGVNAFNVVYNVQKIKQVNGRCFDEGITQATTNAPTYVEGWRLTNI